MTARPLDGVRVLDLSRVLSGPLCGALLADLGAEVIKVERPGSGDDSRAFGPHLAGESSYFMLLNRGKRSITVDLRSPAGRSVVQDLAAQSDVVIENFRPGVVARLGIDHPTLSARNPRLIYLSISGFGQDGPLSARPAYDHVVQAMAGIMAATGWPDDEPTRVGDALADVIAGIYGSWGVLAALLQRATTGRGQLVDVAMLDAMFSVQVVALTQLLGGLGAPARMGNAHPISAPMDSYAAGDGRLVIAVANQALFGRLASAIGDPALVADARFATDADRFVHRDALRERIEAWSVGLDVAAAVQALERAGVPAGPIWDLRQVADSEHAAAHELIRRVRHPRAGEVGVVTQPVRFGDAGDDPVRPAPVLGEHTDEILRELGLDAERIADLRTAGVL